MPYLKYEIWTSRIHSILVKLWSNSIAIPFYFTDIHVRADQLKFRPDLLVTSVCLTALWFCLHNYQSRKNAYIHEYIP